jgi:hypothetical protein
MANAFTEFSEWLDANGDEAANALRGATALYAALEPAAEGARVSMRQYLEQIEHPRLLRQIMDGVGLAEIAGHVSVTPEAVLEAFSKVVGVVRLFAGGA